MVLYFITGNEMKFNEAKHMFPELERLDIDLPELQSNNACEIITKKLEEACTHTKGAFIIEDTSLYIDCMHGLPGPLVKWFLQAAGPEGLYTMAKHKGDCAAEAKAVVGYANGPDDIHFFEGAVRGTIVPPRGTGVGWDVIFQPDGTAKTFGEMTEEEKVSYSQRTRALEQLQAFLQNGTSDMSSCD